MSKNKLEAMGFKKYGDWKYEDEKLSCDLNEDATAENVIYAFISEEAVLYIGKTVRSLKKRMYGYQNPAKSQRTNDRCHDAILESVSAGMTIEIHAFKDNGLLTYGGFHVNLAAGLEDDLIKKLKPTWNLRGI